MKPFTLEWWITWKEYVNEMYGDYDDLSDQTVEAINPNHNFTDQQVDEIWSEYNRYRELHNWIRRRIINKYGEQ